MLPCRTDGSSCHNPSRDCRTSAMFGCHEVPPCPDHPWAGRSGVRRTPPRRRPDARHHRQPVGRRSSGCASGRRRALEAAGQECSDRWASRQVIQSAIGDAVPVSGSVRHPRVEPRCFGSELARSREMRYLGGSRARTGVHAESVGERLASCRHSMGRAAPFNAPKKCGRDCRNWNARSECLLDGTGE